MHSFHQDMLEIKALLSDLQQRLGKLEAIVSSDRTHAEVNDGDSLTLVVNEDHGVYEYGPAAITLTVEERRWINAGLHLSIRVEQVDHDGQDTLDWVVWEFNCDQAGRLRVNVIIDPAGSGDVSDIYEWIELHNGPITQDLIQQAPRRRLI